MQISIWDPSDSKGRKFATHPLTRTNEKELLLSAAEARSKLIDKLCDVDDEVATAVIEAGNYDRVPNESVRRALRTLVNDPQVEPYWVPCSNRYNLESPYSKIVS